MALIRVKRGTQSQIDSGSLSAGELAFSTDTKYVFVGDGTDKNLVGRVLLDTFANRPSPSIQGRFFYSTDTDQLFLDNSTTWTEVNDTINTSNWFVVDPSKYTATPTDSNTLAMSDTGDMAVGLPLRYVISSVTYYGIITSISTDSSIDVMGASLSGDLTELAIGSAIRVVNLSMWVSGTYGDGTDSDLLSNDMGSPIKWRMGTAYLIGFDVVQDKADTSSQPKVNVQLNNSAVSSNDSNNGVQLSTAGSWVANPSVAINTSNYDIQWGEEVEIACTGAGGSGDAEDLTVQGIFVLA